MCAMTSRSKDGELISQLLQGFGFETARGSSSRGGEAAILAMADFLGRGLDAAVTPDGPRGPCYEVQPGVVMLSQLSGIPIVPATYDISRKKRLSSWDRFIVPSPFSRGVLIFGDPLYVDRDADDAERERVGKKIQAALLDLNEKAAEMLDKNSF
jgi:lysophospholipid acyltransferase (LPLAT)-like uncharacterized protein